MSWLVVETVFRKELQNFKLHHQLDNLLWSAVPKNKSGYQYSATIFLFISKLIIIAYFIKVNEEYIKTSQNVFFQRNMGQASSTESRPHCRAVTPSFYSLSADKVFKPCKKQIIKQSFIYICNSVLSSTIHEYWIESRHKNIEKACCMCVGAIGMRQVVILMINIVN